jgi:lysozyme family protein
MDDPTGRGGHLSANHGHRSRATQAKNGGTLQNREDKGGGGICGVAKRRRQGERGRAGYSSVIEGLCSGQRRQLRRPVVEVG